MSVLKISDFLFSVAEFDMNTSSKDSVVVVARVGDVMTCVKPLHWIIDEIWFAGVVFFARSIFKSPRL